MPKVYVKITNAILDWAIKKATNLSVDTPTCNLLKAWRTGEKVPTFKQIERVSKKLQVPFGYFFLQEPPKESFPMLEFRTINSDDFSYEPSENLIETVDNMVSIQDWMRDYVKELGIEPKEYVASCNENQDMMSIVKRMRSDLNLSENWMESQSSARDAFNFLRKKYQNIGILVMMNGIVGNNTHRKLDIREFRAFTLIDKYVPLIFINSTDSWNGRLFSLLHEAVHIWLGVNSIYNKTIDSKQPVKKIEITCNFVASELLVPQKLFSERWKNINGDYQSKIEKLARDFSCSTVVVARKALNNNFITKNLYNKIVVEAIKMYNETEDKRSSSGGSYYTTIASRLDNQFIQALASSAQSGRTQYTDAYRLTHTNRDTFNKLYQRIRHKGRAGRL